MVTFYVNHNQIKAPKGTSVLTACLNKGIYIPNLCHIEGEEIPAAACRLCFIAIEGKDEPIAACSIKVRENLKVLTDTPLIRRLQKTALRLLLSVHKVDCKNCHANKHCELQRIARFLKVGLHCKPLESYIPEREMDNSHPALIHYPQRCVLCGKCVRTCRDRNQNTFLIFAKKGFQTHIRFFGGLLNNKDCPDCGACVAICPVGALSFKS
jgi:NADH dehydrogenase/NADH:ubiquinone oxidoreductase subunit G